jgi:multisubunit Na+/H+ antiporter MnhB subunit
MRQKGSPVLAVVAASSLYVIKILAVWLFLRGHQEPGGGFVAGLVVAAAVALQGMTFGYRSAESIFPAPFHVLLGSGLFLALSTVFVPILAGFPVMKSAYGYINLGYFGEMEWATAVVFDLGVFLVVVGSMKAILLYISEAKSEEKQAPGESERGSRRRGR